MIRPASRRHSSTVLLLRRLLIGHDHARRRAALDNRLDEQSTPHNVGSAYRDRPTEFATPFDRFPNSQSTHLGNRPPAPKSP